MLIRGEAVDRATAAGPADASCIDEELPQLAHEARIMGSREVRM
jgi:hypothetical protein